MAQANFGLTAVAAMGAVTAFGIVPANADIWLHQGTNNTSFATSEMMTGNVTGVQVNISGDNLWAFTARATSQYITVTSGFSNQPGMFAGFDMFSNPLPVGSGYNDVDQTGINMTMNIGAQNVGQLITLVFANYGMVPLSNGSDLYDVGSSGQINPLFMGAWNGTGGQNQFGVETRVYEITGITGVPAPGVLTLAMAGGLLAARRRR
ncbi:MAG: hypothetical protein EYC62_08000 [Alphaproteobacteria bacterium]|nr:MAG: hypothetical protein EYC62_08000 [Alphaproteobacteria bacterium]